MKTFTMNGKAYSTDAKTLELLRQIVPDAIAANDTSAVEWVMYLGTAGGSIKEISGDGYEAII